MATTKSDKVIITCAVTGGIHTPTMSDALPFTPDDIATQSIAAAEAGASILHLHARDPKDGRPTPDPAVFMQFLPRIKQSTDAVINVTTGGGLNMTVEQRLAAPLVAKPEMCSLNMGSMNFAIFGLADRYKSWKYEWEEPYLRGTDDFIFRNTFRDIERILKMLGDEHGTRFEHECYDVGHLYNLAHFVDRGLVKPPFFVQTIFGILGGIGADMRNLMFMKETADRLFGVDYRWSVLAAGRSQIPFATQAAMMGGNVRVGLEDSLFIGRGKLASSNAEQVAKIRRILEELRPFDRDAGGGPGNPRPEGRRQSRVLDAIGDALRRRQRSAEVRVPAVRIRLPGAGRRQVDGRGADPHARMPSEDGRLVVLVGRRHRDLSALASERSRMERLGEPGRWQIHRRLASRA